MLELLTWTATGLGGAASSLALRVCVAYLALYALATPIVSSLLVTPTAAFPPLGTVWPLRDVTLWLAERAFGVNPPLIYRGNSGDTAFHWVQTSLLLGLAAGIAIVWWLWGRDRPASHRWQAWVRVGVRFALAAQMFEYGMAKVIPTQFPPPSLVTLVQPVGSLSLSDLLWTFMGASTAYQAFTGAIELLAAALLVWPATATLGALVALASMAQVFALNMTYDVGLKQIAFHLVLMSVFLIAPAAPRLVDVLVRRRAAAAATEPALFESVRANRRAVVVQVVCGVYLLGIFTLAGVRSWHGEGGAGSARSPLFGIWDVAELAIDGQVRDVASNDYDRRWRRVIFDAPALVVFQRTDDSFARFGARVDTGRRSIALTKGSSRTWKADFRYERVAPEELVLDGEMDGLAIRVKLQLVQLDTFRLLNSTFRWVHPPDPYAG